jgi:mRNA degradation ribonuclease J1/J2
MAKAKTLLTFIGGVNKDGIGGNCSLIEHTDEKGHTDRLMIDLGCKFTPLESGFVAAYPNVDEYLDRVDPETGKETKASKPVSALFITHAHEDHIGALVNYVKMGYKLPPIKAGRFTRNFIRLAFRAEGLSDKMPEIETLKAGDNVPVGDNMVVEAVDVSHSIVDSLGFHTLTFANDKPFAAVMNNGDFLTEEEMPVGKAFNKEAYLDVFRRKAAKQTLVYLDSTSTSPHGKERIGFEKAVENTVDAVRRNPDRNVLISPVIARSIQNIAIDIEAARRLGTKVCLDGKWLQTVREAMSLSGYTDFDDVIYKGDLNAYMSDKQISKKYIVCTGAFAQGLDNYEQNKGMTDTSAIPMASATRMALDMHPVVRIDKNCLILARQRIIDEINGKTGPKMLQRMAAQGAKVVMTPGTHPISNFEQVPMQDSGHVNARAVRELMQDVKRVAPHVAVVPIHGSPAQCEDTKAVMDSIQVPSYTVVNHQSLKVGATKLEAVEDPKATRTWYAVKLVLPNPSDDSRIIPSEGISEYWEVNEQYEPSRKICSVNNVRVTKPLNRGYSKVEKKANDYMSESAPYMGKMFRKKQEQKKKMPKVIRQKGGRSRD